MQKHFDDCLSLSAPYSFGACEANDDMLNMGKPSIAIDIESLENDFELPTSKRSSINFRNTGRATTQFDSFSAQHKVANRMPSLFKMRSSFNIRDEKFDDDFDNFLCLSSPQPKALAADSKYADTNFSGSLLRDENDKFFSEVMSSQNTLRVYHAHDFIIEGDSQSHGDYSNCMETNSLLEEIHENHP